MDISAPMDDMFPPNADYQSDRARAELQTPIEVVEDVDSERRPQLHEENRRSHYGSMDSSNRADIESLPESIGLTYGESDFSSDAGSASEYEVQGEEGVEHIVDVEGFGQIPVRVIMMALARHAGCPYHGGVLPSADDYPFTSRSSSGFFSSSMSVKFDRNSVPALSPRSSSAPSCEMHGSSILLAAVGDQFESHQASVHHFFTTTPLALTAENAAPAFVTGRDISFHGISEYDLW